jgi:hypothetical protein
LVLAAPLCNRSTAQAALHLSSTGAAAVLQSYIEGMLRRAEHRAWCLRHGKTLPPPRLHPVILKVIREWFDLVDDDGSGTLEHHELLGALQVGLAGTLPTNSILYVLLIILFSASGVLA